MARIKTIDCGDKTYSKDRVEVRGPLTLRVGLQMLTIGGEVDVVDRLDMPTATGNQLGSMTTSQ